MAKNNTHSDFSATDRAACSLLAGLLRSPLHVNDAVEWYAKYILAGGRDLYYGEISGRRRDDYDGQRQPLDGYEDSMAAAERLTSHRYSAVVLQLAVAIFWARQPERDDAYLSREEELQENLATIARKLFDPFQDAIAQKRLELRWSDDPCEREIQHARAIPMPCWVVQLGDSFELFIPDGLVHRNPNGGEGEAELIEYAKTRGWDYRGTVEIDPDTYLSDDFVFDHEAKRRAIAAAIAKTQWSR